MDLKREILPNRRKTRMSDVDQLDKTLGYVLDCFGMADVDYLYMGVLRESTRLFNRGDFVVLALTNGGGERWPVYSVSSKGYQVYQFYLMFQNWYWPQPYSENVSQLIPRRADIIYDGPDQMTKFRRVLDDWSVDPTRQRAIVDTLRAAVVERR